MSILAYVDPGLGALVWQTFLSALIGLFFYLRRTRKWIVGLGAKLFRPKPSVAQPGIPVASAETSCPS
jgi:hypothetical protein